MNFISMIKVADMVTPLVGVWIEIIHNPLVYKVICVTPLVGVWIEIKAFSKNEYTMYVTPLVGVWIEMVD